MNKGSWTLTLGLLAMPWVVCVASAETIYVNGADVEGPFDGNTPGSAYRYLQDALNEADGDDQILVAGGLVSSPLRYKPNQGDVWNPPTNHREASFALQSGNQLLGGWAGPSNPTVRDPSTYHSLLTGAIGGTAITDNSYHVVTATNAGSTTVIDGFIIEFGYATNLAGSIASADCYDDDLTEDPGPRPPTKAGGAGMECVNSDLQIRSCTFRYNHSTAGGGLRLLCNSDPLIVNCRFEDNVVVQGENDGPDWPGSGAGIYMYGHCSPKIFNCVFEDNEADHIGGGVALQQVGSPQLVQCTFNGNTAGDYGGGMRTGFECSPEVFQCTFYGNSVTNTGANGGGFSANRDTPPGNGTVIVQGCILWGNTAPSGSQISIGTAGTNVTTIRHCDVQGGQSGVGGGGPFTWGPGNYDADPQFASASTGDFSIPYSSPCLNGGDQANLPNDAADLDGDSNFSEDIPEDAIGQTRQVHPSDCVDGGIVENQEAGSCPGDITGGTNGEPDGTVNGDDTALVVFRWGTPGGIADVYHSTTPSNPCGDNTVNFDDWYFVTLQWGDCSSFASGGPPSLEEMIADLLALLAEHPELEGPIEEIIAQLLEG